MGLVDASLEGAAVRPTKGSQDDIAALLGLFENAKTFGSLIQVPVTLAAKLPEIEQRLNDVMKHGDLTHASARVIMPLLQQARLLARQYDAVVANPPYMGGKFFSKIIAGVRRKLLSKTEKADLYATLYSLRAVIYTKRSGFVGNDYDSDLDVLSRLRAVSPRSVANETIVSFVHNGRGCLLDQILEAAHSCSRNLKSL